MDENKFPHQRKLEGITTEAVTTWNGTPLTGCYLIKNTLSDGETKQSGQPVILFPGGFDPYQGSFSKNAVKKLLEEQNISAVYEAHCFYKERPGYLDPDTYIADLKNIYSVSGEKPILAGMSSSTFWLMTALYQLKQENAQLNVDNTLLIGPFVPDYYSIVVALMKPYYNRKVMKEKMIRFCGHGQVIDNDSRMKAWWEANSAYKQAIDKKEFHQLAASLNTQLDVLFFQYDTLSLKGRRILKKQFGANIFKEEIRKHHRSLLRIPEFDEMLVDYCYKAGAPIKVTPQKKVQNKEPELV